MSVEEHRVMKEAALPSNCAKRRKRLFRNNLIKMLIHEICNNFKDFFPLKFLIFL